MSTKDNPYRSKCPRCNKQTLVELARIDSYIRYKCLNEACTHEYKSIDKKIST